MIPYPTIACDEFSNERGTAEEPYLIYTIEDLKRIGNDEKWSLDKHYRLMKDIVLEKPKGGESNWVPIGALDEPFSGVFDGNGKTITGMVITNTVFNDIEKLSPHYIGFFGRINGKKAKVEGLGLVDVNISLDIYYSNVTSIGALSGFSAQGTIENCYSTGIINGGKLMTGGLIGGIYGGIVERCYSKVNVQDDKKSESNMVGGLIGYMDDYYVNIDDEHRMGTKILRCYTTGDVYGTGNAGGLVGHIDAGKVSNCYSTGTIKGQVAVGGLVGYENNCLIENCYSTGDVVGEKNVISKSWIDTSTGGEAGGICSWGSSIFNCTILNSSIESYGYELGYITSADNIYGGLGIYDQLGKIEGNCILKNTKLIASQNQVSGFISDKNTFKSKEELTTQKIYEEMEWKFTGEDAVWEFSGEYKLPKLIGVGGQDELVTPKHLQ